MKRLNQSGSHIVAIAVGVLVIGVIAFAGYTVTQHQDTKTADSTAKSSTSTSSSSSNGTTSDSELTNDANQLDHYSGQVDQSLNDSSLDADLNDML